MSDDTATTEATEEARERSAVLVFKDVDEQGNIRTEVSFVGDIQPTEVQTLLELGVQAWRSQIGL